jgi:hypothetical protein
MKGKTRSLDRIFREKKTVGKQKEEQLLADFTVAFFQ